MAACSDPEPVPDSTVLQIRPQVGRGSAGEAADVRIFDDRLVELDQRRIDQRQNPAGCPARRGRRIANTEEAPEEHLPGLLPHEYVAGGRPDPSHKEH